ncbi:MAG: flippase [Deltaproteobacteria bacterium]|nr:flippase [Deltaproteobacteria bacterium]
MSTVAKVARNTVLGFLGQASLRVVQLAAAAVLARSLSTAGFGDLGYVIAIQTFFLFMGDFGVEKIVLKEIARRPGEAERLVGAAMTLRALLSVASAVLAALFLVATAPTPRLAWLGIAACATLPFSLGSLYPAFYQARLEVGRAAWLAFLQGAVTSTLLVAAAFAPSFWPRLGGARLELVVAALAIAQPVALVLLGFVSKRDIRPRLAVDRALWKTYLREAAPLAFNSACILITLRADQIILRSLRGADALGQYVAALRLYDAFTMVPAVLLLSAYPLMARYDRESPERYYETAKWSYKLLAVFILPVALAMTVVAGPIVKLLYGAPYASSALPLAILMWSLFFSFTSMVTFDAVTAAGRQRIFFLLSIVTTAVNLALNFLLIPRYGAPGAAVALLLTSALNLPFLAWIAETRPLVRKLAEATWRPLGVTGLLALVPLSGVATGPFLVALLPAYLLLLLVTGSLDRRDLELARRAFGRAA